MSTSSPAGRVPTQTIKPLPPSSRRRSRSSVPQDIRSVRGFVVRIVGSGLRASHTFWRAFPDMPKKFDWYNTDRSELSHYIDRLYAQDTHFTIAMERAGKATAIEYPSAAEMSATEWYSANAHALFATLALRSAFDVPIWGRVRLITDGSYLVPAEYIGALVTARPEEFGHLNPDANWHVATGRDLVKMGLRPEQVTTGMYRTATAAQPVEPTGAADQGIVDEGAPEPPPLEVTIRRIDRGTHIDWLTRVNDTQRVWFARRLYREAQVFYEATAWHAHGPWRVWQRDTSVMLALGITA